MALLRLLARRALRRPPGHQRGSAGFAAARAACAAGFGPGGASAAGGSTGAGDRAGGRRGAASTGGPNGPADRPPHLWTLTEASQALSEGRVTARELLRLSAERRQTLAPLNAFVHEPASAAAEAAAAAADARRGPGGPGRLGPLDGVPFAIKDNFCTLNVPTSAGSAMLAGWAPPYQATLVQRLAAAGAVLVGKTNMDEFGMGSATTYGIDGPALNPWRAAAEAGDGPAAARDAAAAGGAAGPSAPAPPRGARVAGGSSGGSAVAVACGQACAALGSDTGGSVRLPAAWCGVVGFKPSYGTLSRWGLIAFTSSLDTPGLLTRSVADAALLQGLLEGQDPLDPTSLALPPGRPAALAAAAAAGAAPAAARPLAGLRVGLPSEYNVAELSPAAREAWAAGAAWLRCAGAELVPLSLPTTSAALAAYYALAPAEAASNLARYDGVRYGPAWSDVAVAPAGAAVGGAAGAGGGGSAGAGAGGSSTLHASYARLRRAAFGPEVRRRLLVGTYVLSSAGAARLHAQAMRVRALVAADFAAAFARADVLLTPAAPGAAPALRSYASRPPAEAYAADVMTVPASLAGLPAISVPVALVGGAEGAADGGSPPVLDGGLPLGLQLIGPRLGEEVVLRAAAALEAAAARAAGGGGAAGAAGAGWAAAAPWRPPAPLLG